LTTALIDVSMRTFNLKQSHHKIHDKVFNFFNTTGQELAGHRHM
jgi:hypothetical protein